MKRQFLFLVLTLLPCPCFATLADAREAADGYLVAGEYDGADVILENYETLIVAGGGAFRIRAYDDTYIEVQSTSTPLSNSSGIYDIMAFGESELLVLNGVIDEISVGDDAMAILKGGTIDALTIGNYGSDTATAVIYCLAGYTMDENGISGLWADGTAFDIQFNNVGSVYPDTFNFVEVVTVPEPLTLVLLSLGGLLIRRKKYKVV